MLKLLAPPRGLLLLWHTPRRREKICDRRFGWATRDQCSSSDGCRKNTRLGDRKTVCFHTFQSITSGEMGPFVAQLDKGGVFGCSVRSLRTSWSAGTWCTVSSASRLY